MIRDILITNCTIFDSNRGLTLQIAIGGDISNVVISNITMDLHRFDWFWAGDGNAFNFEIRRKSECNDEPRKPGEPGPGSIHNVIIRDVIVHCMGESTIYGHPEGWLSGLSLENIKFFISSKLRNIEVSCEKPAYDKWESALSLEDIDAVQARFLRKIRVGGTQSSRHCSEQGDQRNHAQHGRSARHECVSQSCGS